MSTPDHLIGIGERSPVIRAFINRWRNGLVVWEDMLFELANDLEMRCNELVDKNGMRSQILASKLAGSRIPVLEYTLITGISDIRNSIERQTKLINIILEIENIYEHLRKLAIAKTNKVSSQGLQESEENSVYEIALNLYQQMENDKIQQ